MNESANIEDKILEILQKINNQLTKSNKELKEIAHIGGNRS